MNFQKYKVLIIGGGIAALLLVGGAFLLIKYRSGYVSVKRELDSSLQNLNSLNNNRPFPSEENIQVVAAGLEEKEQALIDLKKEIAKGQAAPLVIGRSDFPLLLEKTLKNLELAATNNQVNLPEGFAFGFDRYAEGDLPDKDKVERLTTQLQIAAGLSDLLFQAGIRSLLVVERDAFDDAKKAAAAASIDMMMAGRPGAPGMSPADVLPEEENDLYTKERFTLEFEVSETSLWNVLNQFAADPMFITVVSVDMQNPNIPGGPDAGVGRERSVRPAGRRGGAGNRAMDFERMMMEAPVAPSHTGTPGAATGEEEEPAGPEVSELSHEERVLAGRESVLVSIDVDVLLLRVPEEEEEPAGGDESSENEETAL